MDTKQLDKRIRGPWLVRAYNLTGGEKDTIGYSCYYTFCFMGVLKFWELNIIGQKQVMTPLEELDRKLKLLKET